MSWAEIANTRRAQAPELRQTANVFIYVDSNGHSLLQSQAVQRDLDVIEIASQYTSIGAISRVLYIY